MVRLQKVSNENELNDNTYKSHSFNRKANFISNPSCDALHNVYTIRFVRESIKVMKNLEHSLKYGRFQLSL